MPRCAISACLCVQVFYVGLLFILLCELRVHEYKVLSFVRTFFKCCNVLCIADVFGRVLTHRVPLVRLRH